MLSLNNYGPFLFHQMIKGAKKNEDAIVTTIHGMAKDFSVPLSVYPYVLSQASTTSSSAVGYDTYKGYGRRSNMESMNPNRKKTSSAIHFPDRQKSVCQCHDCCYRYFPYAEKRSSTSSTSLNIRNENGYVSQRSYSPSQKNHSPPQSSFAPSQNSQLLSQSGYSPLQESHSPSYRRFSPLQSSYSPSQKSHSPPQSSFSPSQKGNSPPQYYSPRQGSSSYVFPKEEDEEEYYGSIRSNEEEDTLSLPTSDIEIVDIEMKDFPLSSVSPPFPVNEGECSRSPGLSSSSSPQLEGINNEEKQHNIRKYICKVCDRGFTWFGNYQKHVLKHGQMAGNDYFFPEDNLSEDTVFTKDESNSYKCKLCDKSFSRVSGLRTHIRMHNGLRPFKCSECALAFTTNRALKMHSRIHSGERPYKCSQCDKSFTRKDELQAHTFLHKGEKPYKCQACSSAFVRQGHLQRHMLTHATEKPYQCKICPKSFTQYRNLQTHIYKHTGERPYKCQYCGKGFTQQGTVQAHERTHTGNKPYACDHCEKRFITSSHLRWHVKKHHNIVTEPKSVGKPAEEKVDL